MNKNERKEKLFTIKKLDQGDTTSFEGYLSTYGNADRVGDVIEHGAFDESIKKKAVVPMLFNHNRDAVIGKLELSSDNYGLKVKGTILNDTKDGEQIAGLIEFGALDSMSIGMRVLSYEPIEKTDPWGAWLIKKAEVLEGSVVTVPANEQATISSGIKVPTPQVAASYQTPSMAKGESETMTKELIKKTVKEAINEELNTPLKSAEEYLTKKRNDYLSSSEAVKDFVKVALKSSSEEMFEKNWADKIRSKGIVVDPNSRLTPALIAESFADIFESKGTILSTFDFVEDVATFNQFTDETSDQVTSGEPEEASAVFSAREIRARYIQKLISIGRDVMRETPSLTKYVTETIPMQIKQAIERAAIINDGRDEDDPHKIDSFLAIADDNEEYTGVVSTSADMNYYHAFLDMSAKIKQEGIQYLITSTELYADAKKQYTGDSVLSDTGKSIGEFRVITPEWMPAPDTATSGDTLAVLYVEKAYTYIGDRDTEFAQKFVLSKNDSETLSDIFAGGALTKYKSAATLKKA